jgi:MFS family permease
MADLVDEATDRGLRAAVRALGHRDFRLFWLGALVSNIGTWVQSATVPYVVYELTGSKSLIGVTAFLTFFPVVLMGPLGGSLADRFSRRRVLLWTQTAMAGVALALWAVWASGLDSVAALMALVALGAFVSGINIPSWQAYVSELVPRRDLLNAVTLNSAQFNAARAVGPAIAGVVLATLGPSWGFFLNAVSFGAVILALLLVRTVDADRERPTGTVRSQFRAGLRYVRSHPELKLCIALVVLVAGLAQPVFQLMPVFAEDVFDVGESGYGLLAGALGFGGVLATPLIGGWGDLIRRSRLVAGALLFDGVMLIVFCSTSSLWVAVPAIACCGAAFLAVVSTLNTTVQLLVEERFRGRVMALYVMAFTAAYPIGALIQGAIADAVGVRATVTGAGVLLLLVTLAARLTPVFDRLDRRRP